MNKQDRLDAFCRILGILIFNCNKIDYKQIFKNKHYSYIEPLVKITTKNQIICIHFNDFFERIIMKLNKRFNFTQKLADDTSVNNNFFRLFLSDSGLSFIEPLSNITTSIYNETYGYLPLGNNINLSQINLNRDELP